MGRGSKHDATDLPVPNETAILALTNASPWAGGTPPAPPGKSVTRAIRTLSRRSHALRRPIRTPPACCLACLLLVLLADAPRALGQVSPEESLEKLKPAPGFEATLFASEPMVVNPTNMDVDSRGRVWITEGLNYRLTRGGNQQFHRVEGADQIKILEDTDGDGKADKVTVFADNVFPVPMGLAIQEIWKDGKYQGCRVFVGNSPNLLVLEDSDGDDKADKRYPLLTGFGGIDSDHGVHGMVLGLDGKLYFTHGDGCCSVQQDHSERAQNFDVLDRSGRHVRSDQLANTLRVNLDGTEFETLANRQRNNYEAALDSFGNVFVSDNDDDGNRGSRMIWIMDGGNCGYRVSSRHWAEELPGIVPKLVGTGNGSPCGLLVYEGDLFPEEYRGAVLQVDAGTRQVNFHPLTRYGAAFRTEYKVLLGSDDPWFRPVDATVAPDGSLFVCDWYDSGVGGHRFTDQTTGRIYRIAPKGKSAVAPPLDLATIGGQIEALRSPVVATRFAARQLLVQGGDKGLAALTRLFRSGQPRERGRALMVLAGMGDTGRPTLLAALHDKEPRIREEALRILTRDVSRQSLVEPESAKHAPARAEAELEHVLPLAEDPDPGVRRELLLALRDVPTDPCGDALRRLVSRWDGRDRYYLEAIGLACRHRDSGFFAALFNEATAGLDSNQDQAGTRWALPPYYPVTTNDAFLHTSDELPPACDGSKIIGLAWELGRPESLPSLGKLLDGATGGNLAEAVDMAITAIRDPQAAEFLAGRFRHGTDAARRREILALLGRKLGNDWKPALGTPAMRRVIEESLASDELRVAAIGAVAQSGAGEYGPAIAKLAEAAQAPAATRQAAIEALGQLRFHPARGALEAMLRNSSGAKEADELALAALGALGNIAGDPAGRTFLIAVLRDAKQPLELRRRTVRVIAAVPGGPQALLDLARREELPNEVRTETMTVLHSHPDRRIAQESRSVLPLPRTARGEPLPPIKELLARSGDPARGQKVFTRERSDACIRCHRVRGIGNWVGPDLSSIGVKYGKDALLDAVINPSASIAVAYQTTMVVTRDGRVLNGLVAKQSPEELVLKTADGQRLTLATADIEERKELNKSIMPDGIAETMTTDELVDLLTFLETLRQPVSTFGQYYVLGPVPDDARGSDRFDPKGRVNLGAEYRGGDGGTVRWRRMAASEEGRIELGALVGSRAGQSAYLCVPIASPHEQPVDLVVEQSGDVQAWIAGKPLDNARDSKSGNDSWTTWSAALPEGPSDLVIRVPSGSKAPAIIATLVSETPVEFRFETTSRK